MSLSRQKGAPGEAPLISIIMNCYNGARYLREAIDSVLAQTYQNLEIILWDNLSTDDSASIFKSYCDERLHYYMAREHAVLGQARNLAVERASGEWIGFLDCDDLWAPDKLEKQVAIIREEDEALGMVYGGMRLWIQEEGLKSEWGRSMGAYRQQSATRLPEGDIFPELLRNNFVPLLSSIVRRSAYWSVGGIDPTFKQAEDYDLFVKISDQFKVRAVQEDICCYRVHDTNLSHAQMMDGYQEAIEIVSRYLPAKEARSAIRIHQTLFAVSEIKRGGLVRGAKRLLLHGDAYFLVHKVAKHILTRMPLFNAKSPEQATTRRDG